MTPRIQSLLDYTFARKQDMLRRDADWAPLLARFVSEGAPDEARARIGLQEMLRAEGENPVFLDGERIAFTRTVRQIPELHTKEEMDARILNVSEHDIRHYLMEYVKELGTIDPQPKNHWRFVPEDWTTQAIARERKILFGKPPTEEDAY